MHSDGDANLAALAPVNRMADDALRGSSVHSEDGIRGAPPNKKRALAPKARPKKMEIYMVAAGKQMANKDLSTDSVSVHTEKLTASACHRNEGDAVLQSGRITEKRPSPCSSEVFWKGESCCDGTDMCKDVKLIVEERGLDQPLEPMNMAYGRGNESPNRNRGSRNADGVETGSLARALSSARSPMEKRPSTTICPFSDDVGTVESIPVETINLSMSQITKSPQDGVDSEVNESVTGSGTELDTLIRKQSILMEQSHGNQEDISVLPLDIRLSSNDLKKRLNGCEEVLQMLQGVDYGSYDKRTYIFGQVRTALVNFLGDSNPTLAGKALEILRVYVTPTPTATDDTRVAFASKAKEILVEYGKILIRKVLSNSRLCLSCITVLLQLVQYSQACAEVCMEGLLDGMSWILSECKGNVAAIKGQPLRALQGCMMLLQNLLEAYGGSCILAGGGLGKLAERTVARFCMCSDKKVRDAAGLCAAYFIFYSSVKGNFEAAQKVITDALKFSKTMQTDCSAKLNKLLQRQQGEGKLSTLRAMYVEVDSDMNHVKIRPESQQQDVRALLGETDVLRVVCQQQTDWLSRASEGTFPSTSQGDALETAPWKVKLVAWQELEDGLKSCACLPKKNPFLSQLLPLILRLLQHDPTVPVVVCGLRVLQLLLQLLQQHFQQEGAGHRKGLLTVVAQKLKAKNKQLQSAATSCLTEFLLTTPFDVVAAELLPIKEKLPAYREALLLAIQNALKRRKPEHDMGFQRALTLLLKAITECTEDGNGGVRAAAVSLLACLSACSFAADAVEVAVQQQPAQRRQQLMLAISSAQEKDGLCLGGAIVNKNSFGDGKDAARNIERSLPSASRTDASSKVRKVDKGVSKGLGTGHGAKTRAFRNGSSINEASEDELSSVNVSKEISTGSSQCNSSSDPVASAAALLPAWIFKSLESPVASERKRAFAALVTWANAPCERPTGAVFDGLDPGATSTLECCMAFMKRRKYALPLLQLLQQKSKGFKERLAILDEAAFSSLEALFICFSRCQCSEGVSLAPLEPGLAGISVQLLFNHLVDSKHIQRATAMLLRVAELNQSPAAVAAALLLHLEGRAGNSRHLHGGFGVLLCLIKQWGVAALHCSNSLLLLARLHYDSRVARPAVYPVMELLYEYLGDRQFLTALTKHPLPDDALHSLRQHQKQLRVAEADAAAALAAWPETTAANLTSGISEIRAAADAAVAYHPSRLLGEEEAEFTRLVASGERVCIGPYLSTDLFLPLKDQQKNPHEPVQVLQQILCLIYHKAACRIQPEGLSTLIVALINRLKDHHLAVRRSALHLATWLCIALTNTENLETFQKDANHAAYNYKQLLPAIAGLLGDADNKVASAASASVALWIGAVGAAEAIRWLQCVFKPPVSEESSPRGFAASASVPIGNKLSQGHTQQTDALALMSLCLQLEDVPTETIREAITIVFRNILLRQARIGNSNSAISKRLSRPVTPERACFCQLVKYLDRAVLLDLIQQELRAFQPQLSQAMISSRKDGGDECSMDSSTWFSKSAADMLQELLLPEDFSGRLEKLKQQIHRGLSSLVTTLPTICSDMKDTDQQLRCMHSGGPTTPGSLLIRSQREQRAATAAARIGISVSRRCLGQGFVKEEVLADVKNLGQHLKNHQISNLMGCVLQQTAARHGTTQQGEDFSQDLLMLWQVQIESIEKEGNLIEFLVGENSWTDVIMRWVAVILTDGMHSRNFTAWRLALQVLALLLHKFELAEIRVPRYEQQIISVAVMDGASFIAAFSEQQEALMCFFKENLLLLSSLSEDSPKVVISLYKHLVRTKNKNLALVYLECIAVSLEIYLERTPNKSINSNGEKLTEFLHTQCAGRMQVLFQDPKGSTQQQTLAFNVLVLAHLCAKGGILHILPSLSAECRGRLVECSRSYANSLPKGRRISAFFRLQSPAGLTCVPIDSPELPIANGNEELGDLNSFECGQADDGCANDDVCPLSPESLQLRTERKHLYDTLAASSQQMQGLLTGRAFEECASECVGMIPSNSSLTDLTLQKQQQAAVLEEWIGRTNALCGGLSLGGFDVKNIGDKFAYADSLCLALDLKNRTADGNDRHVIDCNITTNIRRWKAKLELRIPRQVALAAHSLLLLLTNIPHDKNNHAVVAAVAAVDDACKEFFFCGAPSSMSGNRGRQLHFLPEVKIVLRTRALFLPLLLQGCFAALDQLLLEQHFESKSVTNYSLGGSASVLALVDLLLRNLLQQMDTDHTQQKNEVVTMNSTIDRIFEEKVHPYDAKQMIKKACGSLLVAMTRYQNFLQKSKTAAASRFHTMRFLVTSLLNQVLGKTLLHGTLDSLVWVCEACLEEACEALAYRSRPNRPIQFDLLLRLIHKTHRKAAAWLQRLGPLLSYNGDSGMHGNRNHPVEANRNAGIKSPQQKQAVTSALRLIHTVISSMYLIEGYTLVAMSSLEQMKKNNQNRQMDSVKSAEDARSLTTPAHKEVAKKQMDTSPESEKIEGLRQECLLHIRLFVHSFVTYCPALLGKYFCISGLKDSAALVWWFEGLMREPLNFSPEPAGVPPSLDGIPPSSASVPETNRGTASEGNSGKYIRGAAEACEALKDFSVSAIVSLVFNNADDSVSVDAGGEANMSYYGHDAGESHVGNSNKILNPNCAWIEAADSFEKCLLHAAEDANVPSNKWKAAQGALKIVKRKAESLLAGNSLSPIFTHARDTSVGSSVGIDPIPLSSCLQSGDKAYTIAAHPFLQHILMFLSHPKQVHHMLRFHNNQCAQLEGNDRSAQSPLPSDIYTDGTGFMHDHLQLCLFICKSSALFRYLQDAVQGADDSEGLDSQWFTAEVLANLMKIPLPESFSRISQPQNHSSSGGDGSVQGFEGQKISGLNTVDTRARVEAEGTGVAVCSPSSMSHPCSKIDNMFGNAPSVVWARSGCVAVGSSGLVRVSSIPPRRAGASPVSLQACDGRASGSLKGFGSGAKYCSGSIDMPPVTSLRSRTNKIPSLSTTSDGLEPIRLESSGRGTETSAGTSLIRRGSFSSIRNT